MGKALVKGVIVSLAMAVALICVVPVLGSVAATAAAADIAINEVNFPDPAFRAYVAEEIDQNQDGLLSKEEIATVTEIDFYYDGESAAVTSNDLNIRIFSLKGLEFFTALEYLDCNRCQLPELDISQNINLRWLDCSYNQLTKLDISKNINLRWLDCSFNQLIELDISKNINLGMLSCANNQLIELDISQNINLGWLDNSGNLMEELDVNKNKGTIRVIIVVSSVLALASVAWFYYMVVTRNNQKGRLQK